MAYRALYRKYRPNTFDEVVGQQSIVATLLNAVKTDKLAHAYLFCGPRGTGKTTVAKLLAKTINCQSDGYKPCGKCSSCLEIQNGSHPDVIEMDAATNNGVDEVREIIDKVKYAPMNGKYKVYIIDEVHMMTPNAFNALLKTLEEPPAYCIFIMATTEPHKVLPTIISRCQRFDFKKISVPVIVGRLSQICELENITISDGALRLIAELADGGMRDALSILDQCIAYSQNSITEEDVSAVYGVASLREKLSLFECVKQQDSKGIVEKVNDISTRGLDVQRLTIDLINIAKECVIYSYSHDSGLLTILSKPQVEDMLEKFSTTQLLAFIDYLIETQTRYRDASNALTYFEVCMLKMMNYTPELPKGIQQVIQQTPTEPTPIVVKAENKPVEPVRPNSITEDFNPTEVPKYIEYSDEEYYEILTKSNKVIKEKDRQAISRVSTAGLNGKLLDGVSLIKVADLMACSPDNVIFVVEDRQKANLINEENNKAKIEEVLTTYLGCKKKIIAVTNDQRVFLINYFKAHQNQPSNAAVPSGQQEETMQVVNEENTTENRLAQLFGKDGFDIVEG